MHNSLMHPLIYYVESARSQLGAYRPDDPDEADFWDGLTEAATQLRTAAAEGGEAVAYRYRFANSPCSEWEYDAVMPVTYGRECTIEPLYLRAPTDSGAGRDGEMHRWGWTKIDNDRNQVEFTNLQSVADEWKKDSRAIVYESFHRITAIAGAAGEKD